MSVKVAQSQHRAGVSATLLTALSLLALLSSLPAHGLTCERISEEDSLSLIEEAALIFDGEVVSVSALPASSKTMATARIVQLHKGEPVEDFVSFQTSLEIRTSELPTVWLDIGVGDRDLLVLEEIDGLFLRTNIACHIPWQEHVEQLRDIELD